MYILEDDLRDLRSHESLSLWDDIGIETTQDNGWNNILSFFTEGIVLEISSYPPFPEKHAWFTIVSSKTLSDK